MFAVLPACHGPCLQEVARPRDILELDREIGRYRRHGVGVWMRQGAPSDFVQAANKNLQSIVLERLSNPPEEVQSFRAIK